MLRIRICKFKTAGPFLADVVVLCIGVAAIVGFQVCAREETNDVDKVVALLVFNHAYGLAALNVGIDNVPGTEVDDCTIGTKVRHADQHWDSAGFCPQLW